MLITLLGIVTEVNEEQKAKASSPILVTLSPIQSALMERFHGAVSEL